MINIYTDGACINNGTKKLFERIESLTALPVVD